MPKYKNAWEPIHEAKTQSRTPADCLNFPSRFLLGAVSVRFDDDIYLSVLFVLLLGASLEGTLCSA